MIETQNDTQLMQVPNLVNFELIRLNNKYVLKKIDKIDFISNVKPFEVFPTGGCLIPKIVFRNFIDEIKSTYPSHTTTQKDIYSHDKNHGKRI